MQAVEDEGVDVARAMAVKVRVVGREVLVSVRHRIGIGVGPERPGRREPGRAERRQGAESRGEAEARPGPARHRVGHEPAGMREGELRGLEGRTVLGVG